MDTVDNSFAQVKHGGARRGAREKLYWVWAEMLGRCRNKKNKSYKNYGGRGIVVCQEWSCYRTFREWCLSSGYQRGLLLDRIDNDDGYSPENCRFVGHDVSIRNRRYTIWIEAFGERKCAEDWAADTRCTIGAKGLRKRIHRGMSPEAAITTPPFTNQHQRHQDYVNPRRTRKD